MQNLLLSPIPLADLTTAISEAVKQEMQKHFPTPETPKATELLTRKQTASLLGISLPTLGEWTKTGSVTGYRIASRVRYKRAEIENSLSEIQTRSRK